MRPVERIKAWALRAFGLGEGAVVTVMELRCHDPECPPVETAIAILEASGSPQPYKVHKPMSEVTFQDVERLVASGSHAGLVAFWNPGGRRTPVPLENLGSAVTQLAWSPDDRTIAAGCEDGTVAALSAP